MNIARVLLLGIFLSIGGRVEAQLSDADISRMSVVSERLEAIKREYKADEGNDLAHIQKLEREFGSLLREYTAIFKKDPAFYQNNHEIIEMLEGEHNGMKEYVSYWSKQKPQPALSGRPSGNQAPSIVVAEPPASSELKATSNNLRPNPQAPKGNVPDYKTPATAERVYTEYAAERQRQGDQYRSSYYEFSNYEYNGFVPSESCSIGGSLNVGVPVSQSFTRDPSKNSIDARMPWSKPTNLPGSRIQFQYSLLFYCKIPAATLGDQMAAVMDDYGFVRIINGERVTVRGTIEFEYVDMDGNVQTGRERFVIEPGETQEDIGMWYLACKFNSVRLTELQCK